MSPLSRVRKPNCQLDAGRGKNFCKLIGAVFAIPDRWEDRIGSLRHSEPQHRVRYPLAASGTEGSIEAEVESVGQHIEEYADHKCYYVNTTTPILPRQGAEQPALRAARQQPTIDNRCN